MLLNFLPVRCHKIEEMVQAAGVRLFPDKSKDLNTQCECPDYANPCKHIAPVYYILAEWFDEDPFLIFAMRGKETDELLMGLRNMQRTVFQESVRM